MLTTVMFSLNPGTPGRKHQLVVLVGRAAGEDQRALEAAALAPVGDGQTEHALIEAQHQGQVGDVDAEVGRYRPGDVHVVLR